MASKTITIFILATLAISGCLGGVISAVPAAYSIPYASSYTANVVNHALATPLVAAPAPFAVAAPGPVAFAAPAVGAPLAYSAVFGK